MEVVLAGHIVVKGQKVKVKFNLDSFQEASQNFKCCSVEGIYEDIPIFHKDLALYWQNILKVLCQ